MFFIQNDQIIVDHHRLRVTVNHSDKNWIKPEGTNFLLGKKLSVEIKDGSKFFAENYSALSLVDAYRIISCTEILTVETPSYLGENHWAQVATEKTGRLSYIDGCSNTGIIQPLRNGDPCVNYLFFPPGTSQSIHLHPSMRVGIVTSGRGRAVVSKSGNLEKFTLEPGLKFCLPSFEKHYFETQDSMLSVLVFHPDSDGGPVDEKNPMFSRTFRTEAQHG